MSNASHVHVYPNTEVIELRTHNEFVQCAKDAIKTGKPVLSVKGPTRPALYIPDIIMSTSVDIMHSVFIGVVKKLMNLWFLPKYSSCELSRSQNI